MGRFCPRVRPLPSPYTIIITWIGGLVNIFCLTNVHGADERLAEVNVMTFATALMLWVGPDVLGMLTTLNLAVWVQGVCNFGLGFVKTAFYFGRYFSDYRRILQIYAVQSEPNGQFLLYHRVIISQMIPRV